MAKRPTSVVPGQYLLGYWIASPDMRGNVTGDGYRHFVVLTVGHKWVTMYHSATTSRVRVRPAALDAFEPIPLERFTPDRLISVMESTFAERAGFGLMAARAAKDHAVRLLREHYGSTSDRESAHD